MKREDLSEQGGEEERQKQGFLDQNVNLLIAISVRFSRESFPFVCFLRMLT